MLEERVLLLSTASEMALDGSTVATRVWLPLEAVQVPLRTTAAVAFAARAEEVTPVRVVVPSMTSLTATELPVASRPWFAMATVYLTAAPAAGVEGAGEMDWTTRSGPGVWETVMFLLKLLLVSLNSAMALSGSTTAVMGKVPWAVDQAALAVRVALAPAARVVVVAEVATS